jgi:hypothetical protein
LIKDKVDLVLWAKNGDATLWHVLKQTNKVIPANVVNKRILINDHSIDGTPAAAFFNGWTHITSRGCGISDAANHALSLVETEYFCSFEQDIILNKNWWGCVSPLILGKGDVAAASGLRFLRQSDFCYSIEPYELNRQGADYMGGYGKTLDNTIWNTNILRKVGGFPKLSNAGIDTYLAHRFEAEGYQWIVNYDVKSVHVHFGGLSRELKRYQFYGASLPELYAKMPFCKQYDSNTAGYFFGKLVKSPISGLKMALRMRDARLALAYPSARLMWLLGYLRGQRYC